jgi:hypothetical protein
MGLDAIQVAVAQLPTASTSDKLKNKEKVLLKHSVPGGNLEFSH